MTPIPLQGQGPILIAGQTASGKSALAIAIAKQVDGVVVNADSMQVYDDLQVLTARPTLTEMQGVSHRLYGHVPAREPYSVGRWLADVAELLAELLQMGQRPIFVGGTGLYFKALLEGLSPIPDIPVTIREKWRLAALDPGLDLHALLALRDPLGASRLNPADRHRLARALEVVEATGRPLPSWQGHGRGLVNPDEATKIVLDLDRQELYRRCDSRFERMMLQGGLEEVKALLDQRLSPTLPAMRALGVRPLTRHLQGELDLAMAIAQAQMETRHYAKRQMTWLGRNMIAWNWLAPQETTSYLAKTLPFV